MSGRGSKKVYSPNNLGLCSLTRIRHEKKTSVDGSRMRPENQQIYGNLVLAHDGGVP